MNNEDKIKIIEAFQHAIETLPKVDVPVPYRRLDDGTPMTYRKLWEACMNDEEFFNKADKKIKVEKIKIDDLVTTIKQGFYPCP
jgi:hypothetical protein